MEVKNLRKGLMKITCDPKNCGFMVRSHNKNELISLAQNHVKKIHHKSVPTAEMKKMIKKA